MPSGDASWRLASADMNAWLDRLANLAVVLTCGTLIVLGIARMRPQNTAPPSPAGGPTTYARGDRMNLLNGVTFARTAKTIVIYVRSTCQLCVASMDFYRALANEHGRAA